MCGVAFASYAINAMDRQLFPLLASDVQREYGFSLAGIGLLSTIFTLGMALAGLPTGFLLARFSRKAVLQGGIAVFSAGTALTVISSGFVDMLIYRAATGVGEAMQLTVLVAIRLARRQRVSLSLLVVRVTFREHPISRALVAVNP